jgi:hypothetical protein
MARDIDWAFDVQQHFVEVFADRLGFDPDEEQHYPDRITGTLYEGDTHNPREYRAVVIPRPVGYENASRYRRWVTLPPVHWENITNRPAGWRHFVLMVGLLPDGQPWWSRLYDEQILAGSRDHSEQVNAGRGGHFYRFDPGLTAPALVLEWDKDKAGDGILEAPGEYQVSWTEGVTTTRDAAEWVAKLWELAEEGGHLTADLTVDRETMVAKIRSVAR